MGEFERIARLRARFGVPPAPARGIGDDCAWVPTGQPGGLALSVDASVDGVHFRRAWLEPAVLAARAVEAALSDLAAAGASVRASSPGAGILCAWTLPSDVDEGYFDALVEGTARAAERHGACVLGGNLSGGPVLSLTTTVLGRTEREPPGRGGARAGDLLWLTGAPGMASLGLRAYLAGRQGEPSLSAAVRAWSEPRARMQEGALVVPRASAAIDVSDGLAQDAGHLAHASGVALRFDAEALPERQLRSEIAASLGCDPERALWSGGEDYELLVALPAGLAPEGAGWSCVGECAPGEGVWLVQNGRAERSTWSGYAHGA